MKQNNKLNSYLSILLIFIVLFIFTFNFLNYDPIYGYDAEAHYEYVEGFFAMFVPNLSDQASNEITREFFNPPLPYVIPAVFSYFCKNIVEVENEAKYCQRYYGKIIQLINAFVYLLTLYFYLLTFKLITKKDLLNLNLIIPISILAVNYKTFSMLRGEPFIIFFNSMCLYYLAKYVSTNFKLKLKDYLIFGLLLGLMGLSRQWAFLIFPAYAYFLFPKNKVEIKKNILKFLTYSFTIAFFVCSWFYFKLFFEFGTFTAFNMSPKNFNLNNQPLDFYVLGKEGFINLFSKPIRPNLGNNFFGIMYSELWGDYWGYFVFTSRFLDIGRSQMFIGDYLGRVNIVSIIPTFFILFGFFKSSSFFKNQSRKKFLPYLNFIKLASLFSIIGYLWFLIKYPEVPQGGTNKATYMIQFFHLITFSSVFYLYYLEEKKNKIYLLILVILGSVFVHNFSTYLSHF